MTKLSCILAGVIAGHSAWAAMPLGSAEAGRRLFETQNCIHCHSVNGEGGKTAPDLGRRAGRNYTPTIMVALMWNHAPTMWSAMQAAGLPKPELTEQSAADLFAYFVAARFFEPPGDAARGKSLFSSLHCADCHGITKSNAAGAPPVAEWGSLTDAVALAQQMWNHSGRMREEFAKRHLAWIHLTGQQLTDILLYLQNLPETRDLPRTLDLGGEQTGQDLFRSKGCAGCHTGTLALDRRLRDRTLTDIAAEMWNHAPLMKSPVPTLDQGEMRQILGYIWAGQYFANQGDARRGLKVFTAKQCASCHAEKLKGRDNSDISMVTALWQHGPQMLAAMRQKNIPWPRFTAQDMADVIAYLNSLR
jgi:mono/diheme cytochrome c family protein